MNGAFYIGAVGLDAQQRALEVVANNVANINTTAFKRSAVRFSALVSSVPDGADKTVNSAHRIASLAGTVVDATSHVWTQGALQQTGQQFDLAINGDGFLELDGSSGRTLLWRGGTLKVNDDGFLAAADGTPLRNMISVPQGSTISISSDGVVSAQVSGQSGAQQIGQLDLVTTKSIDSLTDDGAGRHQAADPSELSTVKPGDDGSGMLVQGALESSNAQLTDEMTTLLLTQRAFAANAQVVQAGDQIMSIVNGLRR
jgi:flagellar basal-body rod protein FlgG